MCGRLPRKPFMTIPMTDRSRLMNTTATIRYRIPRNMIMETSSGYWGFFLGVCFLSPGFENFVSTVWPMVWSMALAVSANGPSGSSSRYFWNASAVPGGGVIFPSAVGGGLADQVMPY